ncbi:MAG: aminotransferase [Bacteroidetes bacterium 4572_77]|nr:MAG: aminotransferase [Bacteroidetes bacterium 4572_77]
MNNCLIKKEIAEEQINALGYDNVGKASIREIVRLVNKIEAKTGIKYIRMEMGVPGLPAIKEGIDAQVNAIEAGVDAAYPMIDGYPGLKEESSKFMKNFADIDVSPSSCIPTCGSMQGTYAAFLLASKLDANKDTALFIDPGFPVQKLQMHTQGNKFETFDIYSYRGDKLGDKLEEYLSKGNINSIIYSNPNNPSWISFTEEELQIIAEKSKKYDVVVMEDLAYFGLDFRKDVTEPGIPPYQSTIARYYDNWVIFLSGSKIFSYAGPRCAMMIIADNLYSKKYPYLKETLGTDEFGHALVFKALYPLSAGVNNSAQRGLAALFQACNEGRVNFVEYAKPYADKAKKMKNIFTKYGFHIIYDLDGDEPIADGFYFTVGYGDMKGADLLDKLIHYGISAISLGGTGSTREGIRACVSHIHPDQFKDLAERLAFFQKDFPV